MSGFFGIFSPTAKIDTEAFEQMRKASEKDGFDGMETIVEDQIAMGHLMLRVSPESKYDKQPLKSTCGNYMLVGHFRLDYRDELGDKLGLVQSDLKKMPDSVLTMMAYEKWKEKCVDHLEGDWAFVIYSRKDNNISLFKDRMGISALYYYKFKGSLLFASSAASIQAINKINFEIDMIQLCRKSIYGLGLRNGYTLIKDLFFLKFGYFLHVNSSLDLTEIKYWQLETLHSIAYSFEEDYAFEMHSKFSLAVKSRMIADSKSGLFLSSGLDSTAVASYLSKELELNKKLLYSYTSYPVFLDVVEQHKRNLIDETKLVKELTSSHPGIHPEFLNFPETDIVESIKKCIEGDPKYFDLGINSFWINGILEKAKNDKVDTVFTGQMGNYVISWNEEYKLLNLFLKAKFISLLKEILQTASFENKNFILVFKSHILGQLFYRGKLWLKRIFYPYNALSKPFLVRSGILSAHTWKKELDTIDYFPNDSYYMTCSSKKIRTIVFNRSNPPTGLIWYKLSHENAMISLDPTRDERLVEFAFSIPESLYYSRGKKKYLYKIWMRNFIPSSILNVKSKSLQSADIAKRFIANNNYIFRIEEIMKKSVSSKLVDYNRFYYLINIFSNTKSTFLNKRSAMAELFSIFSMISFVKNQKIS